MTQKELNRAVARATGESVSTIARLGFGIADRLATRHDSDSCGRQGRTVDWDAFDAERPALFLSRRRR